MNESQIINVVKNTLADIQNNYPRVFASMTMPEVKFTIASDRLFGTASPTANKLDFNIKMAGLIGEDFLDTVLHELAHLMVHHVYQGRNKQAHGPEFRKMCSLIGCKGSTYVSKDIILKHQIEPKRNKVTRVKFDCECGFHYVTTQFAKRNMGCGLKCTRCNAALKVAGSVVVLSNHKKYVKK